MLLKLVLINHIKNIISQFGVFSAENLAMYTKFEYKIGEVRAILKDLEKEGYLKRGYFIQGDDTLYWIVNVDLEKLRAGWDPRFPSVFVLPPDDRLATFLTPRIQERFRMGNCFVIFEAGIIIEAFKGRMGRNEIVLRDVRANTKGMEALRQFAYRRGLRIVEKSKDEPDEWDIISYVDKTRSEDDEEEY